SVLSGDRPIRMGTVPSATTAPASDPSVTTSVRGGPFGAGGAAGAADAGCGAGCCDGEPADFFFFARAGAPKMSRRSVDATDNTKIHISTNRPRRRAVAVSSLMFEASPWCVLREVERDLDTAGREHGTVGQRDLVDALAVDGGAVRGRKVLGRRPAGVGDDLEMLAGNPRIVQLDMGLGRGAAGHRG